MIKLVAMATVLMLVDALDHFGQHNGESHAQHHVQDYYTEPHYNFVYQVQDLHTHDVKSHKEERKGDHTQGVYYLVEPDGSKRTVEYHVVGKSGFNAVVHREHNKHPTVLHKAGYNEAAGSFGSADYKAAGHFAGSATSFAALSSKASHPGASDASSGYHTLSYTSLGGAVDQLQNYKTLAAPAPAKSYSSADGAATSSVKFVAHGAHIDATTHHVVPVKHHY